MYVVFGIIVVFLVLILYCLCLRKGWKSKSIIELNRIKENHNITYEFFTVVGFIVFSDETEEIFIYNAKTNEHNTINYKDIISCDNDVLYGKPDTSSYLIVALTPERSEFCTGSLGEDDAEMIYNIVCDIISSNYIRAKEKYNATFNPPLDSAKVHIKNYSGNIDFLSIFSELSNGTNANIWADKKNIYILPQFETLEKFSMNINLYKTITIEKEFVAELLQEGGLHYTTDVHGGGGGGVSITGAIVGGMLAGELGAIIGSREETDPISTTTNEIDNRTTNLKLLDSRNNFAEIVFEYNDYYAIAKLLGYR